MIRLLLRRAALAGLVMSAVARLQAEPVPAFDALSDSSPPLDSRQVRDRLEALGPLLQMDGEVTDFDRPPAAASAAAAPTSTGSSGLPPAVLAQLKGTYESSIAQIQGQIAKLKPDDASGREMLQGALTRSVQNYTQMFGTPPPGVSATSPAVSVAAPEAPADVSKPTLKRPVIGNRALTLTQALASLNTMLLENSTAQARAAFAASPHYQDAGKCGRAAAGALAVNRVTAALAALLRARELAPKEPAHLCNLAGLTTRLGMPRHTLALLDAADKLGKPAANAVTMRAATLTNRGHALIQLKRFGEAEVALREAAKLAPAMREARVNLAHALYQQNDNAKKKEAQQTMMFARWRQAQPVATTPSGPAPTPAPPTSRTAPATTESESGLSDAEMDAERKGRLPASAVFDLSRRKSGGLPTIKIPRTIGDGYAMYPKVQKLEKDLEARMNGIVHRMIELDDLMRKRERSGAMSAAGAQRARDVFWYIANTQSEHAFRGLWREVELASRDPGLGLTGGQIDNPWASLELMEKHDRIRAATMPHREYCIAMWNATEPFHGSWQGPIRRMETAINRYYHVTYPHMTALAANLGDKYHHEYAMLMIEQKGLALMGYLLGPLHTVCFFDTHCVEDWGPQGEKGQAEEPKPGQFTVADMCGALSKDGYKAVFDLEVVELSVNCEKVGAELSAGQWVKLFGEVECTYDGEVTIFVGGAVEGEIPFVGVVETGAKAGGYVTIDFDKGVVDAGVKSTESIKVGVGPVGVEREIEHTYVIATFGGT